MPNDARDKCERRRTWGVCHTHLPETHEPWCTKCSVCSCSVNWSYLLFKSWVKNEGQSNLAWMHSTCATWSQGRNIPDWMTHPEGAGPQQEVEWHHHWTNRRRVSHGKAMGGHKRRSWVNQPCITCKSYPDGELGTNPLPWDIQEALQRDLWCDSVIHMVMADRPAYKWLLCACVHQG